MEIWVGGDIMYGPFALFALVFCFAILILGVYVTILTIRFLLRGIEAFELYIRKNK